MPKPTHFPVYIGENAISRLIEFCRANGLNAFTLIADRNTYAAVGQAAEAALCQEGYDVHTILLEGEDILVDANFVYKVMLAVDRVPRTYVAAGSGTITDITRFVSHRTGRQFISLPSAPSVDGYTSVAAPMVIDGIKATVLCHGPIAVFADLPVLCAAPRKMLAAGFGDLVAKVTSVADWQIGALLYGEPYDAPIARRSLDAAWSAIRAAAGIASAECEGVRTLMEGLIETGFCMLDFGDTRPASGYEHHMSHLWEMKFMQEGRRPVMHGTKVGIGVVRSLRVYDALRGMSRAEAGARLAQVQLPDRATVERQIRAGFGPLGDEMIKVQQPYLDLGAAGFAARKQAVLDHWEEIQAIVAATPTAGQMTGWLEQVGGPSAGAAVGLSDEEVRWAETNANYLRDRFTVAKLAQLLGLLPL